MRRLGYRIRLLDCLDRSSPYLPFRPKDRPSVGNYGSGPYYHETISKPPVFKDIRRRFKRYGLPVDTVKRILRGEPRPDVILVTTGMTYWYPAYADMIGVLKSEFPKVPVLLGGNYANLCFDHARTHSGADHVFKGTDTAKAVEFVDKVAGGKLFKGPGVPLEDLFPAYDLYPRIPYVTLKTSHGCPFRCTYCGWYLVDGAFRRQPPAFVVDEISYFHKNFGVDNFAFYDDALLFEAEEHFMKIARGIIENAVRANFLTPNGLHNRFLTGDIARAMKMAGFIKPRLALETSSRRRQQATGGKTTNEDFLNALKNLREAGYTRRDIGAYILIGLPGQTAGEIEDTIRFAAKEGLRIHLEEYSPIPGTADYGRSGLSADADPLLHNNSAFLERLAEIQRLKDLTHHLNLRQLRGDAPPLRSPAHKR